jgi:septal ring factor EnvC (AmiA/AmiB activator)
MRRLKREAEHTQEQLEQKLTESRQRFNEQQRRMSRLERRIEALTQENEEQRGQLRAQPARVVIPSYQPAPAVLTAQRRQACATLAAGSLDPDMPDVLDHLQYLTQELAQLRAEREADVSHRPRTSIRPRDTSTSRDRSRSRSRSRRTIQE